MHVDNIELRDGYREIYNLLCTLNKMCLLKLNRKECNQVTLNIVTFLLMEFWEKDAIK
jgi:hypothetical protein